MTLFPYTTLFRSTETGEFGAYMQVDSLNDGPLTIILDTDTL